MSMYIFGTGVEGGLVPTVKRVITKALGFTPANIAGDTFTGAVTVSAAFTANTITSNGDITGFSDERLKANWRNVKGAFLDNLAHVKSGIFDRTDQKMTQAGVSAQDVQKFFPEVVHTNPEGIHSVAYGQLAAVACVELAKEVMALRKELEELKK